MSAEPDPDLVQVAKRLRAVREAAGMTQVELAERSGITLAHINRLENARREPGIKTVVRLARALDTTPSGLLRGIGSRSTQGIVRRCCVQPSFLRSSSDAGPALGTEARKFRRSAMVAVAPSRTALRSGE